MRTVVIFLILANLTLFGYTFLDGASGGESFRLTQQVQPDKIKLLTPQQVAALGPAKVASLADVCLEWGPFSEGDRARALADLDPLGLGKLVTQRRADTPTTYWTFLPPFANRAAADKRLGDLKAAGLTDAFVVDGGSQRFAIGLGAWRTEDAANAQQAALAKRGISRSQGRAQAANGRADHACRSRSSDRCGRPDQGAVSGVSRQRPEDRQLRQAGGLTARLARMRAAASRWR